jgi:hypothetical protein
LLNYSFYPFINKLENLDSSDLALLKEVSEGWYIDYKSQRIKISDLAKHLSAFANQYGGWLVIGIEESTDGTRTAGCFTGIPDEQIAQLSIELREATSAHVNPEVLYEEIVIKGPQNEIGLAEGYSILIVGIPQSDNTPHIHSSGRIYRRLADQSKPKEEVDRYILDDLWKRGNKNRKMLSNFLTSVPELPPNISESPVIHVFFKPSQYHHAPSKLLTFDDFSRITRNIDNCVEGINAPMDSAHSTSNGFCARQLMKGNPNLSSIGVRWWFDGTIRIDIHLNKYDLRGFLDTHNTNKYAYAFHEAAIKLGYKEMSIIDYSSFANVLAAMTNMYLHILDSVNDERDIYSCFTMRNLQGTNSFVNSSSFIDRVSELSIPLVMDNDIIYPEVPSEENMIRLRKFDRELNHSDTSNNSKLLRAYLFSSPVLYKVVSSVGIASDTKTMLDDHELWGSIEST